MSSNDPQYNITNGPSKWDLSTNFFTEVSKRGNLFFTIKSNRSINIKLAKVALNIIWLGLEDGSADNFLIKGSSSEYNFSGFYNSRERTGYINFTARK